MSRRKKPHQPILGLEIIDFAAEGKCIGKVDEKVVFVPFTAPGDIIDAQVTKSKKNFVEAKVTHFHQKSDLRIEPRCEHFSVCGGCKWQHIPYDLQTAQKEMQVKTQLLKIGGAVPEVFYDILSAPNDFEYRNKVELSFSDQGWIEDVNDKSIEKAPALGFHVPGRFDKVLNINHCHLVNAEVNEIIQFVSSFSKKHEIPHYQIREHQGVLRNLIIRTSNLGGLMVILVATEITQDVQSLLDELSANFKGITSLNYIINTKKNDTVFDLEVINIAGEAELYDKIGDLNYKIRPKSFFQTNSNQVYNLYQTALKLGNFSPNDVVYDLYTGTGSIALFVAKQVKKVVGIEILQQAIDDAKENALNNEITNCNFFVGDMKKAFTSELMQTEGKPNIIIADPPRNGMDKEVIETILTVLPKQLIYISCNPATQARDIALLKEKYVLKSSQAVDMFPQTHHVENVVLMELV